MTRSRDVANIDTILTTKGDIYAASAAYTPTRLGVGNNGETLVADSSTTTGLRWQSAYNGNWIINGGFDWWQRGTSFSTPAATYTADRWAATRSATTASYTVSRQTSFLTASQYAIRVQRDSGQTATPALFLGYAWESQDVSRWQGKTMTLSFWARAGANFSSSGSVINVSLFTGTGTDQGPFVGHTGETTQINVNQVITTSGVRYSFTFTAPSNATSARININYTPTGTAGANDWFEIANTQLEFGSVATEFKRSGVTLAGELAACQRYYVRWGGQTIYEAMSNAQAVSTTGVTAYPIMPVEMRVIPSSVGSNAVAFYDGVSVIALNTPTMNVNINGRKMTQISFAGTGLTQYRYGQLIANNSTSAYLELNAEL